MEKIELRFDEAKFRQRSVYPTNTLQFFITELCNKRCRACFYAHRLSNQHMSYDTYKAHLGNYYGEVGKVILLGGEPTLHPEIRDMIRLNNILALKTTIYTNGYNLDVFRDLDLEKVTIRLGVMGAVRSEKALASVKRTDIPVTIVYMLRPDNIDELWDVAKIAESEFNCANFYISSIRDIAQTRSYWLDNEETIPLNEYFDIVQDFVNRYDGRMNLHISRRGIIKAKGDAEWACMDACRFGNIFPDGKKIICPFDISLEKYTDELNYGRKCNKDSQCILRKVVLERI